MPKQERYILALDQGTTSSRSCVINEFGSIIGMSQKAFKQYYPQPGWVEHNADEIWESQLFTARQAITAAQIEASQIATIGITNQRETVVLWDRSTGQPVYNAIVWQCRRSSTICRELINDGRELLFREKTGLVLDPYFSGTKIAWLLREYPGLRKRADRGELAFGTIDSWLLYKLTGKHLTDATNASRTLLFNIHTLEWDESLLSALDIPISLLPEVKSSSFFFGETHPELFGRTIPVSGCAGDQQASLFGHACFQAGNAKNTFGTGCFTLLNTGDKPVKSENNLLTTIAWQLPGQTIYALEGSVFIAGALIQWLRDELCLISTAAESENLALSVPDTNGVMIVPAFVGLGAPYWDPEARGTIVGLTRGSGKAHIVRAALESIAFQSADLLESMRADFCNSITELRADGGAAGNNFLMRFQADIAGIPVLLSETNETTALGAAYLAGLAVGFWQSLTDIEKNRKTRRRFLPSIDNEERQRLMEGWKRAVNAARSFHP